MKDGFPTCCMVIPISDRRVGEACREPHPAPLAGLAGAMPRGRTGVRPWRSATAQTIHQRGIKTKDSSAETRRLDGSQIQQERRAGIENTLPASLHMSDERIVQSRWLHPHTHHGRFFASLRTQPRTAGRVRDLDTNDTMTSGRPVETVVSRMQLSCATSIPKSIMWNRGFGNSVSMKLESRVE